MGEDLVYYLSVRESAVFMILDGESFRQIGQSIGPQLVWTIVIIIIFIIIVCT